MAIWGFGYKYGGVEDKLEEFVKKQVACSGWGKDNEYFCELLNQVKIGDIVFLKTYDKGSYLLKVRAIGIVTGKGLKNDETLGVCIQVKYIKIYDKPLEIKVNDSVLHRGATLYEELSSEVCRKIINELLISCLNLNI